jgi:flagellin FlaB
MPQDATPKHLATRDDESGSIGIGAMIVFIALILVAAVASTIIIKTAEELQQNAESTSDDTRKQISGKVSILDVFVKTTADPLTTATGNTDVATMDVIARIASGSIGVAQGDISYYISCKVTYTGATTTYAVIDSGPATAVELDDTAIASGVEIGAGSTFKFTITLTATDASADGTDVSDLDFAAGLEPGCDAEAGVGQTLDMRIVVDGGGETLSTLEIDSLVLGTSLM